MTCFLSWKNRNDLENLNLDFHKNCLVLVLLKGACQRSDPVMQFKSAAT